MTHPDVGAVSVVTGTQCELRQSWKRTGCANGHSPRTVGEASAIRVKGRNEKHCFDQTLNTVLSGSNITESSIIHGITYFHHLNSLFNTGIFSIQLCREISII